MANILMPREAPECPLCNKKMRFYKTIRQKNEMIRKLKNELFSVKERKEELENEQDQLLNLLEQIKTIHNSTYNLLKTREWQNLNEMLKSITDTIFVQINNQKEP